MLRCECSGEIERVGGASRVRLVLLAGIGSSLTIVIYIVVRELGGQNEIWAVR